MGGKVRVQAGDFVMLMFALFKDIRLFKRRDQGRVYISFHINGDALSATCMGGTRHLTRVMSFLKDIGGSKTLSLIRISFYNSTSPRKSTKVGQELTRRHHTTIRGCIHEYVSLPSDVIAHYSTAVT